MTQPPLDPTGEPLYQSEYTKARALLDDTIPAIDRAIAAGHSLGFVAANVGADLAPTGFRDPFALASIAAVALVEVHRLRADLAACESVAADARTHWPVDRAEDQALSAASAHIHGRPDYGQQEETYAAATGAGLSPGTAAALAVALHPWAPGAHPDTACILEDCQGPHTITP